MTIAIVTCPNEICDGSGFIHIEGTTSARQCQCRLDQKSVICYAKAGIPPAYMHATLENFKPEKKFPAQAEALASMKKYVANWKNHLEYGDGAAVLGPTRIGKSHIAIATGRAIIDANQTSVEQDLVYFVNITNWVQAWKDHWTRWPVKMPAERKFDDAEWNESTALMARVGKRMKLVDLLILDDLGEVKSDDRLLNRLYDLVEYRTSQLKPIIVTSNHSWDTITRRYGDDSRRIVDRLRESSVDHTFIFEKQTRKRKKT